MDDNYIKEFVVDCSGGSFVKSYNGQLKFLLNDVNKEKLIEELSRIGLQVIETCPECGGAANFGVCLSPARHNF